MISQNEKAPNSHYGRGLIFLWQGKLNLAIEDFSETLRLDATHVLATVARAQAYLRSGRLDEALTEANAALKIAKKREAAFVTRADILLALGKTTEAIDDYSEAIKPGEAAPQAYAGRAQAYEKQGRTALAVLDYQKAVTLDAGDPLQRQARLLAQERLAALENQKAPQASVIPATGKTYDLGRRIALVVGQSAYRYADALPNPTNDAAAVAQTFRQLGFTEVQEIRNAPRGELETAIKDFGDRAEEADWAVVFYAGHGMQIDGHNYLIPTDAKVARAEHAEFETLNLDRVLASAGGAKKLGIVILDACRNNPFLERLSERSRGTRALAGGFARVEPRKGQLVVYATRENHTAADGGDEHSPFTHALLYHISEPGIDVERLFRRVRDTVLERTSNAQEPFTYGSLPDTDLYFKAP